MVTPGLQSVAGLRHRTEQGLIQELVAQPSIDAFDKGVLNRDVSPGKSSRNGQSPSPLKGMDMKPSRFTEEQIMGLS